MFYFLNVYSGKIYSVVDIRVILGVRKVEGNFRNVFVFFILLRW